MSNFSSLVSLREETIEARTGQQQWRANPGLAVKLCEVQYPPPPAYSAATKLEYFNIKKNIKILKNSLLIYVLTVQKPIT